MAVVIKDYRHALTRDMIVNSLILGFCLSWHTNDILTTFGYDDKGMQELIDYVKEKQSNNANKLIDLSSDNTGDMYSINLRECTDDLVDIECHKAMKSNCKEGEIEGVCITYVKNADKWKLSTQITVYIKGDDGQFDTTREELEELKALKTILIL